MSMYNRNSRDAGGFHGRDAHGDADYHHKGVHHHITARTDPLTEVEASAASGYTRRLQDRLDELMNEFRSLEAHEDELRDELKRQEWEQKHDVLKSKKKKIDRQKGFAVDQSRNMTDHQRETWVTDEERRLELQHEAELSKLQEDPVAKDPTKIPMKTIALATSMKITLILLRRGMEVDCYCSSWPNFGCVGAGWREASVQLNTAGETELDIELANPFSLKGALAGFLLGAGLWWSLAFTVFACKMKDCPPDSPGTPIFNILLGLGGMVIFTIGFGKALFKVDKKRLNLCDLVDVRYREQTKGKRSVDPSLQDGRVDLIFSDPKQAEVCLQFKNEDEGNFNTSTNGAIDLWFQKFFNGQQIAAFIATGIEGLSRHVWTLQNEEYLKEFTDDVQLERLRIGKWLYDAHRVNSKLLKIDAEKWLDPEQEKHRKPREHQHQGSTKMVDTEEVEEASEDYDMFGKVLI